MKISEVIQKLEILKKEKGNIPVVVKGFDTWGFDDVKTVRGCMLVKESNSGVHGPKYGETSLDKGVGTNSVVFVGF